MLLIDGECDHVADGLDQVMRNHIERRQCVEVYLAVYNAWVRAAELNSTVRENTAKDQGARNAGSKDNLVNGLLVR